MTATRWSPVSETLRAGTEMTGIKISRLKHLTNLKREVVKVHLILLSTVQVTVQQTGACPVGM